MNQVNNKKANLIIIILSVVVAGLVSILTKVTLDGAESLPWDVYQQPKLHAIFNSITAVCLIIGYIAVKNKNLKVHRISMFTALSTSALFLLSYVTYHGLTEPTAYGGEGILKTVYTIILVSHIILAALIFPIVLMTIHRAITGQIEKHKKMSKYAFPLWLYVAITGVIVYLMLAPYYGVQ